MNQEEGNSEDKRVAGYNHDNLMLSSLALQPKIRKNKCVGFWPISEIIYTVTLSNKLLKITIKG